MAEPICNYLGKTVLNNNISVEVMECTVRRKGDDQVDDVYNVAFRGNVFVRAAHVRGEERTSVKILWSKKYYLLRAAKRAYDYSLAFFTKLILAIKDPKNEYMVRRRTFSGDSNFCGQTVGATVIKDKKIVLQTETNACGNVSFRSESHKKSLSFPFDHSLGNKLFEDIQKLAK